MLTTVRRSRPKGPLRAVPGATNNRKIGGRLCYCDTMITPVIRVDCHRVFIDVEFIHSPQFTHACVGEKH